VNYLSSFKKLKEWSCSKHAELPWRKKRSLYFTLVSEIMLQQTTVSTVKNHFELFLEKFPDVQSLAFASEEQMLRAWKGLGYYRRAKNLRKAALDIVEFYQGEIPLEFESLKGIKGIGDYTANALLAIGDNQVALALDANLERVLARVYGVKEFKGPPLHKKLHELFFKGEILSEMNKVGPRFLTEALMDLGREFCQARKANCESCPLKNCCKAFLEGNPLEYPRVNETKKKEKFFELTLLRLVVIKDELVLAYKKEEGQWLSGQWELPTFIIETEDEKLKQYPHLKNKINFKKLKCFSTSITKYKIKNYILECDEKFLNKLKNDEREYAYHAPALGDLSTASTKALAHLNK